MSDTTPKVVRADPAAADRIAKLIDRRGKVRAWWATSDAWTDKTHASAPIGFAFSGGGIRSATFCLGLLQAMARSSRDALSKIDVLSTVSGGGYTGCFLRSLFVPLSRRGIEATTGPRDRALDAEIVDQYAFARATLASTPDQQQVLWHRQGESEPRKLRNPMWWLREHSRYLAPNGPTDFNYAIANIARNWLAMIYLFTLACTAVTTLTVALEAGVLALARPFRRGWDGTLGISPLFALTLVPLVHIVGLIIGYWGTQAMSSNEPDPATQRGSLERTLEQIGSSAIAATAVLLVLLASVAWWHGETPWDAARHQVGGLMTGAVVLGIVATVYGAATDRTHAARLTDRGTMLTAELRARLTNRLAKANLNLMVIVAAGIIDSLGAMLDRLFGNGPGRTLLAALIPALAYLIKKLPDWVGGTGTSVIGGLLKRFATTIALVAGVVLYGLLALGASVLVHRVAWGHSGCWMADAKWSRLFLLTVITWILMIVSGRAHGFINLSSLHTLYSARLTRAYLGGTNIERLAIPDTREEAFPARGGHVRVKEPTPVNANHASDYIQPRVYGELDLPAPIHIINVTLNETIDLSSQIVARDRKGDIMSLEPGGIRMGKVLADWGRLTNEPPDPDRSHAENVSLGQWISISGAAASSGMGRLTSLGFALAFTFANVRLGYWWWAPRICPDVPETLGFQGWLGKHFGTFVYLANEMTCRYSLGYDRKYLTDGGHYENSGAYALIRRRVPLVLVADNGADPDFQFNDLQVLVRQVRIDLGGESVILQDVELFDFLDRYKCVNRSIFVDPAADKAWRATMTDVNSPAFALALRVTLGADVVHLVWIKPRTLPGIPMDVTGYAAAMKPFPQQSTGDQFFDEAQWESYRWLGEETMNRLLVACPGLLA